MNDADAGPYAILRTEKLKTWGNVSASLQHNVRSRPTPNANPDGEIHILAGANDYAVALAHMQERLNGITVRKNAVLAFEVLLTASPAFFRPEDPAAAGLYDEEKTRLFTRDALAWAEAHFGADNIISATLHVDESTPHLQLIIQPIDPQGRLNASHWLDGNRKLSMMQDSFADCMAPLGLLRGLRGSLAQHSPVKKLYGAVTKPMAEEKPLPRLPENKWNRVPSILADLWEYPQMKAQYESDLREREQLKTELRKTRQHNIDLRETNAQKARALELAERKAKEAAATARKHADENAELRKSADRLRQIGLHDVLLKVYGAETLPSRRGATSANYKLPDDRVMTLIKTDKGFAWQGDGKKGRGAIDLVMFLDDLNFDDSLKLLATTFGTQAAVAESTAVQLAILETRAVQKLDLTPFPTPAPAPGLWPKVSGWIKDAFGIPGRLLSWMHELGLMYADKGGNAVFKRQSSGAIIVYPNKKQRTLADADGGYFLIPGKSTEVYLTDSPIDALAIKSIHHEARIAVANEAMFSKAALHEAFPESGACCVCHADSAKAKKVARKLAGELQVQISAPPRNQPSWSAAVADHAELIDDQWSESDGGLDENNEFNLNHEKSRRKPG